MIDIQANRRETVPRREPVQVPETVPQREPMPEPEPEREPVPAEAEPVHAD